MSTQPTSQNGDSDRVAETDRALTSGDGKADREQRPPLRSEPPDLSTTMPPKVEAHALANGAHVDCLAAGPVNACGRCKGIVMSAFDAFYGDLDTDRLRTRIAADGGRFS